MKKVALLILVFSACHSDKDLILHSFNSKSEKFASLDKMGSAYNIILFLGKKDTLYDLKSDSKNVPYDYYCPFIGREHNKIKDLVKNLPLKVFVDTSNFVNIHFFPEPPLHLKGEELSIWENENICLVTGYPVYIFNFNNNYTSVDTEGPTVSLLQEAKDDDGNWKPIEYRVPAMCGNGYADYILAPYYYIITSIYKYSGDYNTEIRVKVTRGKESFYSNTFRGSINKGQFISIFK
jgi:hypothetical protein